MHLLKQLQSRTLRSTDMYFNGIMSAHSCSLHMVYMSTSLSLAKGCWSSARIVMADTTTSFPLNTDARMPERFNKSISEVFVPCNHAHPLCVQVTACCPIRDRFCLLFVLYTHTHIYKCVCVTMLFIAFLSYPKRGTSRMFAELITFWVWTLQ